MPVDHTERGFEQAIKAHLLAHGYGKGDPAQFDAKLALDAKTLVGFLRDTQPKEWERLAVIYGKEVELQKCWMPHVYACPRFSTRAAILG